MLDFARIFGLKTVVFRHSSMYGGRQFATIDQGWVGWFCQMAKEIKSGKQEPFPIFGNGKQVRDVLHAQDMIALYNAALDRIDVAKGQAFNIGGGMDNNLSLLELFTLLEEICGCRMRYVSNPCRASDQRVFVADLTKATRLLGWRPEVRARQGVEKMVAWVNSKET